MGDLTVSNWSNSGGMTVAFNDVVLLKDFLSPENIPSLTDTNAVLSKLNTFHWKRKNYCTSINVLAMALYRLFAADHGKNERKKKKIHRVKGNHIHIFDSNRC
jgi:2-polyprenyl-6-methoxyphenol hydroxylase-like FAD-dependent oxidoreductase